MTCLVIPQYYGSRIRRRIRIRHRIRIRNHIRIRHGIRIRQKRIRIRIRIRPPKMSNIRIRSPKKNLAAETSNGCVTQKETYVPS